MKFYSSVRLDVRPIEKYKDGDMIIGNRVRVKVVKNKVAPPFRQAEFDIIYGKGISRAGDVLDLATTLGILNKTGTWYIFGNTKLGQGREGAKEFLGQDKGVMEKIESEICKAINDRHPASEKKETSEEKGKKVLKGKGYAQARA